MVNNNNGIPIEVNKKSIEIVYELKEQDNYQSNWLAKTFLSNVHCAGESKNKRKVEIGEEHLINTLNGVKTFNKHDWWDEDESVCQNEDLKVHNFTTSAKRSVGLGGMIASGDIGYSAFRISDNDSSDIRIGSVSVGGEAGMGVGGYTARYSANVDVANARVGAVRANIGIDVGSGVTAGVDGIEAKVAGVGFSLGKKTGISTPFGGISVDFDDCVIQ
ncbi:protein of unknown function [endosymbiont DhMRE of Dentiscutata heterogama]|uniref:hypothetical protein n=1 Tax=endosymbiont DhMRE of Dentiscutata heterogama TaxID=1609546 RepID=UPI000629D7B4|nr:hypothetical protein [endosymbiont DhMRE of Dentiscutata heterogama]CFW92895.1 protein of unknown function [endosymbiont DhMRE of Dentiscutata heterogama]